MLRCRGKKLKGAPYRPWNDLNVLRTHVVSSEYELFDRPSKLKVRGTYIPITWYNDMKYLCGLYNTPFRILDSQNMIYADTTGEYDGKEVHLRRTKTWRGGRMTNRMCLVIFFHELSHRIQSIVGERLDWEGGPETWPERLSFERAACDLSYYLWKIYLPSKKIVHAAFRAYRSKEEVEFLRDWFDSCKNGEYPFVRREDW